ncbi:MAG TPA: lasso peptide biosynthesis B2 protein [Gemmatimonadaceae bacterium]|jgi:hypothetical protein|nr:lasso peptide biosynthesis B2 protein [Gemmatimonadaceae bacterium]
MTTSTAASSTSRFQHLSILEATYTIAWIKVALHVFGLERTLAWCRKRIGQVPVHQQVSTAAVNEAVRRIAMAAAIFPGRALCFEQSLAGFLCLRRRGVLVDFCLGVQPLGFTAHAWLEYHGRTVNEQGELVRKLVRLPSIIQ